MLAASAGVTLWSEFELRRAERGDTRIAPLATRQPDPAQALKPGETLSLSRVICREAYRGYRARSLLIGVSFFIFMAAFGEVMVWLALPPAAGGLPRQLMALNLAAWAGALTPIALAVYCGGSFVAEALSQRRQTITADDRSVSVAWSWGRPQVIPWDDIQLILRVGEENP